MPGSSEVKAVVSYGHATALQPEQNSETTPNNNKKKVYMLHISKDVPIGIKGFLLIYNYLSKGFDFALYISKNYFFKVL